MSENIKHPKDIEDDDDDEDEDYLPEKEESGDDSEDEKKTSKRKIDSDEEDLTNEEDSNLKKSIKTETTESMKEEDKKKADDLWASFLKDVKTVPVKSNIDYGKKYEIQDNKHKLNQELNKNSKPRSDFFSNYETKIETENYKKETEVNNTKEVQELKKKKPIGMAGILEKISKQEKLSTLEKSKIDWEEFKKEKNIEEDLATRSKGKESYLDKQAFLERADLRQFEIEKELRDKERRQRDAKF